LYKFFPQNLFLISKQIRWIVKNPIDDIKQNLNIQKKLMQKKKKHGIAYIRSTLSNTIITVTDHKGDTKTWSSSGSLGFKGSRRSTNYAAQATAENAARTAIQLGIKSVEVEIKGLGYGKESSLRGLRLGGLIITKIRDVTPTPHNGCRPPKKRRV
jgi:small subunit ribosomal protein S11